ncbi:MAG TPA: sulfotransferase [Polyangiaceae bacterium]|nr:sulfotransferase [Polyangiaceae bacterium]
MDLSTPPPPHRPLPVRLLNGMGRLAFHVTGQLPRLDEASLLEAARRRTGLSDFGPERFREGLRVLLRSLEEDAALNAMGRIVARAQVVHALAVRQRLVDHRRRHPGLAEIRIARPLFVLGLPRTGTTILYGIIAQDPAHRSPASWELADPLPPPDRATYDTDRRIARTEADFDQFRKLVPNIDSIHPMGAKLPQECVVIMAYDFHSLQYELCFNAVSYQAWYLAQDLRPTYSFHREVLQLLSSRAPAERWVLKSPQHLASLDALLAEYPDALIVQTHRDPVKVLPSVSSLHYALRAATTDALAPRALGEEQSRLWSQSLSRATAARERLPQHAAQFVDVQFQEILKDPLAVVRRIYRHFDLPLTDEAERRMKTFIAAHPRDKHGAHHYTAAMFGLDAKRIQQQFADYYTRFDVPHASAEGAPHAVS